MADTPITEDQVREFLFAQRYNAFSNVVYSMKKLEREAEEAVQAAGDDDFVDDHMTSILAWLRPGIEQTVEAWEYYAQNEGDSTPVFVPGERVVWNGERTRSKQTTPFIDATIELVSYEIPGGVFLRVRTIEKEEGDKAFARWVHNSSVVKVEVEE